jgi:phage/plasmid-like protein (TIGR03299 family)
MRNDNWDVLGVVGGIYQGVDNASSFAVADTLHREIEGSVFDRGFELDYGRRVVLSLATPGQDIRIGDGDLDVLKIGMRFSTAHDGQGKIRGKVDISRLVCTNGMTVAIPGVGHEYAIRHTTNAQERLDQAHKIMAKSSEYVQKFAEMARFLVNTPMSDLEYGSFIDDLFPMPIDLASRSGLTAKERRDLGVWERRRAMLLQLFKRAETNESGRGTRWAAFNSVTELADWGTTVRQGNAGSPEEARALRQLEGVSQDIKDRAFLALAA